MIKKDFNSVESATNKVDESFSMPVFMRRVWIKTAVVFLLSISVLCASIILWEKISRERLRNEAVYYAAEQGLQLQRQLNQAFSSVYAVAGVFQLDIAQGRHFQDFHDFENFANTLLPFYDSVSSLQLAPNAVVSQIVPLAGNEKAIGHDLLADENRRIDAQKAIDTKKLTLSGPYDMVQGGKSLVGRLPLFIKYSDGREGEYFWGLVIATVRFDTLMAATTLQATGHSGYLYELSKLEEGKEEAVIFSSSSEIPLKDTTDFIFPIPNGQWRLSVKPVKGWTDVPLLCIKILTALAISIFITILGHSRFKKPMILQQLVASRTKDLAEANEALKVGGEKLYHMAHHDMLTGLPNRAMFDLRIKEVLEEAKLKSRKVVLLYVDLDFFKSINDVYGHIVGDAVLKRTASVMKSCIRENDFVSRLGGDEFAVLIKEITDSSFGEKLAKKIDEAIKEPFFVGEIELKTSASVGVAIYPEDGKDEITLSKRADAAMYEIKGGRQLPPVR